MEVRFIALSLYPLSFFANIPFNKLDFKEQIQISSDHTKIQASMKSCIHVQDKVHFIVKTLEFDFTVGDSNLSRRYAVQI